MPDASKTAILLLAHGTPDRLSEMATYLDRVTGGRPMPPAVVEELQHRYAAIGLGDDPLPTQPEPEEERPQPEEKGPQPEEKRPPLTRWTLAQGRLLGELLGQKVYVAMRNWHPFIADVVAQMKADGVTHARVLCLAPQNSRTSTGLYRRALESAVAAAYSDDPAASFSFDFIPGWADEPLLAEAFAERLLPVYSEARAVYSEARATASAAASKSIHVPVLFTAHSVPCRTILSPVPSKELSSRPEQDRPIVLRSGETRSSVPANGIQDYGPASAPDPYPVECKQTAAAVAQLLAPAGLTAQDWFFAFQSQGIAGAPWLGPTVPDTLRALAAEGHRAVVLQPIGFLCDHVEILYDIDIDFRQQAAALGLQLFRAPSLNDSPTLIRALTHVLSAK